MCGRVDRLALSTQGRQQHRSVQRVAQSCVGPRENRLLQSERHCVHVAGQTVPAHRKGAQVFRPVELKALGAPGRQQGPLKQSFLTRARPLTLRFGRIGDSLIGLAQHQESERARGQDFVPVRDARPPLEKGRQVDGRAIGLAQPKLQQRAALPRGRVGQILKNKRVIFAPGIFHRS